jgi:hypothetical protein
MTDPIAALTAKLEPCGARAAAISMGTDLTTDAEALLAESSRLWTEIADAPADMLPVVARLAGALAAALANAPQEIKDQLDAYEAAAAAARFDRIEPPRLVVGFLFLAALERVRDHCADNAHEKGRDRKEART